MNLSHRHIVPLILLAAAAIYIVTAYTYQPDSRAIPLAVAFLLVALLVLDLVMQTHTTVGRNARKWLAGGPDVQKAPGEGVTPVIREVAAFAWIVGFLVLAIIFGFYLAIPIYVFGYLRFHARKSIIVSAIPALGVVGLLYLLFQVLLGYDIFNGLIVGDYL